MKLLIVESPGKIKKLKSILGPDFEVAASIGHIRDLPAKDLGIDKKQGFKPLFQINTDKMDVVKNLLFLVNKVGKDNVFLATDEDREGESISSHLSHVLGLNEHTVKRVKFNAIEKNEVLKAVANPGKIDLNLVEAAHSRRVIDRLLGYEISPIIWDKLPEGCKSAGRVQSPALRLIVEREREINGHESKSSFTITAEFLNTSKDSLRAKLINKFSGEEEAINHLKNSIPASFSVSKINKSSVNKSPQPPFSTSSLQIDAGQKLKLDIEEVMKIAQTLYESGHITYMRTDSVNLSDEALNKAKEAIINIYGEPLYKKRIFKNKSDTAQEAHEAIRPTHFETNEIIGSDKEKALYSLIYNRALASQMADAIIEHMSVDIIDSNSSVYRMNAKKIAFQGFMIAYIEAQEDEEDTDEDNAMIKALSEGERLTLVNMVAKRNYTVPPKRYTQTSLVSELEKNGIGRPSTYAPTVSGLLKRSYIVTASIPGRKIEVVSLMLENGVIKKLPVKYDTIGGEKNKLQPTETGNILTDFLEKSFPEVVDYKFTSHIEEIFDQVAIGKQTYLQTVTSFDEKLSSWTNTAGSKYRSLEKEKKGNFLGLFEDSEIRVGKGQYGTYVLFNKVFFNLPNMEPDKVTFEMACETILKKRISVSSKVVLREVSKKITIFEQDGKAYVYDGETRATMPPFIKREAYKDLEVDKCKEIIANFKKFIKSKK